MSYNGYGYVGFSSVAGKLPMRIEAHTVFATVKETREVVPGVLIVCRMADISKKATERIITPYQYAIPEGVDPHKALLEFAARYIDQQVRTWNGYRLYRLSDFEKKAKAVARRPRRTPGMRRRSPVLS